MDQLLKSRSVEALRLSQVMSLNELGFEDVQAGKVKLLVLVAASTGDGDPPDNAAKFYATMRCSRSRHIEFRIVIAPQS